MEFKDIESLIIDFGKNNILYWTTALAGEVGEYCNMIKKFKRDGRKFSSKEYGHELADIFIYLVLNARHLAIDLETAILEKIKIIELRINKDENR